MQPKELIRNKRDGRAHTAQELSDWLSAYLRGEVADYQMSAWLMAVVWRGLTLEEMTEWTRLMWRSGKSLPRENRTDFWIDKHSTGGVGDKTSLILVPLVTVVCQELWGKGAVKIPMISGRGLGHSGGTLDKLESVPGFRVQLDEAQALALLDSQSYFMMGQTPEIAPADRRIYALRDVTATVESLPLIVSSILSKKLAENIDGLVMDVKVGSGAFMKDIHSARALASALKEVAGHQGVGVSAVITRMEEPLGLKTGNWLEVEECEDYLSGKSRPQDLHAVVLALASAMVALASRGKFGAPQAKVYCEEALRGRAPLEVFYQMFQSQGGSWEVAERQRESLRRDYCCTVWNAPSAGFLTRNDALVFGDLVGRLGGGRAHQEDSIDPLVGVEWKKKVGDPIKSGECVAQVFHRSESQCAWVSECLSGALRVGPVAPPKEDVIVEELQ